MSKSLLFFCICYLFSACSIAEEKKTTDDPVVAFEDDDKEMNQAITTALSTLTSFDSALNSKNPSYRLFALKCRFAKPDGGGEHIWVSNISLKNGNYFGVVDNLPSTTTEVKIGDTIEIKKRAISDWMYLRGTTIRGAYTLRVIRNRMSPQERKVFDSELGVPLAD